LNGIFEWLSGTEGFPPRWECGTGWTAALGWTHIVADLLTFAAYLAIPTTIWFFLRRRDDLPFPRVGWCFVAFIFACGVVHLLEAVIFWEPLYRLSAVLKVITALVSVTTAVILASMAPKLLAMPRRAAMVDEFERSNRELESFAVVASHDLSSPLSAIGGYIDLVNRGSAERLDAEDRDLLIRAQESVMRMQGMIDSILDLSRVAASSKDDLSEVDPAKIFEQQCRLRRDTGAEFQFSIEPGPRVRSSTGQLERVFGNLIDNAIKYSEGPARIEFRGERVGSEVQLSFRDYGIGIPPQHRDRVFELFRRLHSRSAYEGNGIGLAMCRRIIEHLGGRIWVAETEGPGTTIAISLPQDLA
jgi:two-component system, chemotaxis family, sensor kinase Cph1